MLPIIDLDAVKLALYRYPFLPMGDCLRLAGIAQWPVTKVMELDPDIETAITFWLTDRLEGGGQ